MSDRFANVNRALPTISNHAQLVQYLATWRNTIQRAIRRPVPQAPPFNFSATNQRGGILLTWNPGPLAPTKPSPAMFVRGAPDSYEILKSPGGSFSGSDLSIIPVRDPKTNQYFDSLGGNATTCSYRIRTTAGTTTSPYSQHGTPSGAVTHTSIDSNDTVTVPSTKTDVFTSDFTRARNSRGNYGAWFS